MDKLEGAEREIVGDKVSIDGRLLSSRVPNAINKYQGGFNTYSDLIYNTKITAPSTEYAKQWDGWGSALKPANEPIVLARKPLEKGLSIAENVLKWGVGGINIDASRIGLPKDDPQVKLREGKTIHAKGINEVYSNGVGKIEGAEIQRGAQPGAEVRTAAGQCRGAPRRELQRGAIELRHRRAR